MLATASNQERPTTLADDQWQAVVNRDRGRDGHFVFAVSTTGIYCRPSCPARRPRPENVSFFANPAAAERAGYRACRRCRPKAVASPQEELVARAMSWLDAHIEERVTLPRLAAALSVSPGHVQRTFTRVTGISPRAYAAARRLELAKTRLRNGADVTSALHASGYGSSSRFYAQARASLGMTPTSYKQGGQGMTMSNGRPAHRLVGSSSRQPSADCARSALARMTPRSRGHSSPSIPGRRSGATTMPFAHTWTLSLPICGIGHPLPRSRSTWRGRRFNTRSGRHYGQFRLGDAAPTAR
jgi:methylphosphotriester-DNA--protein-cysteine methyltransferase